MGFKLTSSYKPTGDQPQAIEKLTKGIELGLKNQVLLGVTGSGKTFTMANLIQNLDMPALVISHNKTLAGQLYQEMREFFPQNAVSYFVSYYDYYQPEAYIPQTDTYIEKEVQINELIDKLRLAATTNIMTRPDAIVVASVSCIYNLGSPIEYGRFILELKVGEETDQKKIAQRLVQLQYERSDFEFTRGTFRVRGDAIDIYPAYEDVGYRITLKGGKVAKIVPFEPISGLPLPVIQSSSHPVTQLVIYPAKHYLTDPRTFARSEVAIRTDLEKEVKSLKARGKVTEAERLLRRANYDLEMIKEVGYVSGIENYSRYFDGREPGDPPYSLLDYFRRAYGDRFLVFIDESHMTVPQLKGMYRGDHSRKETLIDFGFRMQAALDNRPLKFEEFYKIPPHFIYTSATPDEWEMEEARQEAGSKKPEAPHNGVVEQLIRPTGITDPEVVVRPAKDEVQDLIEEINDRARPSKPKGRRGVRPCQGSKKKGSDPLKERILVTTLTKKTAEDLADYLKERGISVTYLHSDVATLERSDILDNLRKGEFDVLIGVNLLREGLDLPEVTLVAILDADREGFLRSKTALIQTMGRAARNVKSQVILYADEVTRSIKEAIAEIDRRREVQLDYNKKHGVTPETIVKPIRAKIVDQPEADLVRLEAGHETTVLEDIKPAALTPYDKKKLVKKLEREMKKQAEQLNFELAIKLRDKVCELKEC